LRRFARTLLVLGLIAAALRFVGPKLGKRMERMLEDAPGDFPPKWMYVNITAIRENTERILEVLQQAPEPVDTFV